MNPIYPRSTSHYTPTTLPLHSHYTPTTLPRYTPTLHFHVTLPRYTSTLHSHYTPMLHSHATLPRYTSMLHSHAILPRCTPTLHSHYKMTQLILTITVSGLLGIQVMSHSPPVLCGGCGEVCGAARKRWKNGE